jgi:hypothetical protein
MDKVQKHNSFNNELMCSASQHESIPEGDAAIPYDDSNCTRNADSSSCDT